jgi:hypothetical protein
MKQDHGLGISTCACDAGQPRNRALVKVPNARILKPGGGHVYAVSYYRGKKTVVRAVPNGDEGITHVMKPDYHVPIDTAGSLVVTEWGDELCDFVFRSSRMTTAIYNFYDPRFGLKGEFLDVLISRKVSVADLVAEPGRHRVGAEIS